MRQRTYDLAAIAALCKVIEFIGFKPVPSIGITGTYSIFPAPLLTMPRQWASKNSNNG